MYSKLGSNRNFSINRELLVWIFIFVLGIAAVPGVPGSDYLGLIRFARQFAGGRLSYFAFLAQPHYEWIFDHQGPFFIAYVIDRTVAALHLSIGVSDWLIAAVPSLSGAFTYAVIYSYLLRCQSMMPARAAWLVLAIAVASYGDFILSGNNAIESFMSAVMACRLFVVDRARSRRAGVVCGIFDALLIILKPYSLFYIAACQAWRLRSIPRRWLGGWLASLGLCIGLFTIVVAASWNYPALIQVNAPSFSSYIGRVLAQYIDLQTGMLWCAPFLWLLCFSPREKFIQLLSKIIGIIACTLFFAKYSFFDGDVPGGRYIFPFLIGFVPELAVSLNVLLDRRPRATWILPILMVVFLPMIDYRMTAIAGRPAEQNPIACRSVHPAFYAWRVVWTKFEGNAPMAVCYHGYLLHLQAPRFFPGTGLSRIPYLLSGGPVRGHDRDMAEMIHILHRVDLDRAAPWQALRLLVAGFLVALGVLVGYRAIQSGGPARKHDTIRPFLLNDMS